MEKTEKISLLQLALIYYFVFGLWFLYRYFTHLPEVVDELIVKPILWIYPVMLFSWSNPFEFTKIKLDVALISALAGIGLSFLQVIPTILKWHTAFHIPGNILFLLLATVGTAISEEIFFRAFIFGELKERWSENVANVITSVLFSLMHLPIFIFILNYRGVAIFSGIYITFVSSIVFGILYTRFKSLRAPIIAHFFLNALLLFF